MPDPTALTAADFKPLEGKPVTVTGEGIDIEATLVEVATLGNALRDGGGFSLLFQGPPEPGLRQATYRLNHSELGTQEVFLVPVGRTDAGYQYEAVFT